MSPPITASSPERLATEFLTLADHFASLETPDFTAAALLERVASALNKGLLDAKGISQSDCMRWIAEGILDRKKHRRYLGQIQVCLRVYGLGILPSQRE